MRHERPLARQRKLKNEDDDDEPTYVDEDSHDTISKAEYDKMVKASDEVLAGGDVEQGPIGTDAKPPEEKESSADTLPKKEAVAAIGASGKRRLAKVVGEEDDFVGEQRIPRNGKKPPAKKTKKVKLSFAQDP